MDNKPCEEGKMYTIEDIQKLGPCEEYTKEKLKELWEKKESLSRRDILELDIPIDDKNWVIPRLVPNLVVVVKWAHLCAHEAKKHAASAAEYATRSARYAINAAWYVADRADARSARYARYARYAAEYARSAARSAANAAADAAYAAEYAINAARYAADADAAADARYAKAAADARYADADRADARDKELCRLLTILCDMAEE